MWLEESPKDSFFRLGIKVDPSLANGSCRTVYKKIENAKNSRTSGTAPYVLLPPPTMADSDKKIILYDFPGRFSDGSWSPSIWKAR